MKDTPLPPTPPATQSGNTFKKTANRITELSENQVFVFGSNLAGIHGAGAAKWAMERAIVRHGQGMGLCCSPNGASYAIATKDYDIKRLEFPLIDLQIEMFLHTTRLLPEMEFLVTLIGCGLAGFEPKDIAPSFFANNDLDSINFSKKYPNVSLPEEFWNNAHLPPTQ